MIRSKMFAVVKIARSGGAIMQQCRPSPFTYILRSCSSGNLINNSRSYSTASDAKESPKSTLDPDEVKKFNLQQEWWRLKGPAAPLHTLNKLRVPLVVEGLAPADAGRVSQPLAGKKVLDVGCGAGILSEALCRVGANVTGLDACEGNIVVAIAHAQKDPNLMELHYHCQTVEEHEAYLLSEAEDYKQASLLSEAEDYKASLLSEAEESEASLLYDGVVCSEVIEHVDDPEFFVETCCRLVKPGGSIFLTTINKTQLSYALAIVAAEYVMGIVERGSHDWNKFISPEDLSQMLQQNGMHVQLVHGMTMNPLTLKWCWIKNTDVNYAIHAIKPL